MERRIVDWGFRIVMVLNALILLGAVGAMELGNMGIVRGVVTCFINLAIIGICWKWRNA